MQFTTKIPIEKFSKPISYDSNILSLGSCFADNMDEKFHYYKFSTVTNPFGIIFNPVSLERIVHRIVNQVAFTENDIFFHNEAWHCFEVHSELSHPNKDEFLKQLNSILNDVHSQIRSLTHCIITLGTAWVYQNKASERVVANCHKVPQNQFTKELLSVATIQKSVENIVTLVQQINKEVQFICTVSPVRHAKDGFVENNVSKAHLLSAVYTSKTLLNIAYFPSYEIVLDELRDYRFYAEDMLHPNAIAIQYIWQRFKETVIDATVYEIMDEVATIQKALAHKPFNPLSANHVNFVNTTQQKISNLQKKLPSVQF
ncbi:GSCFA domain-containing protein [Flavobacterium sp. NRK F7]|uniref:GSCFA domain-containing protein n=1 Tax=Flavobacterium sp. NRK F7 TaxID=2954930 RepID=UPI002090A2AD|nr:GSCFA domain-containing protein [Flavobacterium sp. NRK F7]MCO6162426.1 GSCFA domain-containing protein [Flavobacterium sp. NRK F7]